MSTLPAPNADTELIACGATTYVRFADVAQLPVSARRARRAWPHVGCELGAAHGGSHVVFLTAADRGEQWWWLRWGPQTRDVVVIDPCAVEGVQGAYPDDCLLPDRHPGPHSFEVQTPGPGPSQ